MPIILFSLIGIKEDNFFKYIFLCTTITYVIGSWGFAEAGISINLSDLYKPKSITQIQVMRNIILKACATFALPGAIIQNIITNIADWKTAGRKSSTDLEGLIAIALLAERNETMKKLVKGMNRLTRGVLLAGRVI